jgi:hypothetical protein
VALTQDDVFQRNLANAYTQLGELPDVGPKLLKAFNDQLGELLQPGRAITGKEVQAALRKVDRIGLSFKKNELYESSIAPRLNAIGDEIRGVVERQAPDVLPQYDAARSAYRKVSILGDAVKRATKGERADSRGVFTPEDLQAAGMANAEKFTGKGSSVTRGYPLQDLTEAGMDVLVPSGRSGSGLSLPLTTAALVGGANYLSQPGQELNPNTGMPIGEARDPLTSGAYGLTAATLATLPFTRTGQKAFSNLMLSPRSPALEETGALLEKYGPRIFGGTYGAMLGGAPTRGTPDVTGGGEVPYEPITIKPKTVPQEVLQAVEEEQVPVNEKIPETTTFVDPATNRQVERDPTDGTYFYVDDGTEYVGRTEMATGGFVHALGEEPKAAPMPQTNAPRVYAQGGSVQQLKKGGQPRRGYDYANAARTVGQGLTFGFGDEIEAKLRSLASKDPNAYANEVKRIRMLQERYAKANPGTAMVLEGAGMLGGSLLAPSLAGVRAVSNAGRVARLGAGAADDLLQGAAYSAGKADTNRMQAVREDAPGNALIYAGMSGSSLAAKKAAQKALATNRGYRAARGVYNAVQDPLSVFRRR